MEVIPLGSGFAAEVRGVGLADVAERDDAYRAVRAAFEEHSPDVAKVIKAKGMEPG